VYASKDPDVLLFGKILKNELEEDFRFAQIRVRERIFS